MKPLAPRPLAVFLATLTLASATVASAQPAPRLVADLGDPMSVALGSTPNVAVFGDRLVFAAADLLHDVEPWISDGTTAGTELLADLTPGPADAFFHTDFQALGDLAVFANADGVWRTDGTAQGTWRLGLAGEPRFALLGVTADAVVMARDLGDGHVEVWVSDGTAPGERLAVVPGRHPAPGERLGDVLYLDFGGFWRTDGTAAGTFHIEEPVGFGRWLGSHDDHGYIAFRTALEAPSVLWRVDAGGTAEELGGLPDFHGALVTAGAVYVWHSVSGKNDAVWRFDTTPASDGVAHRVPELETGRPTTLLAEVNGLVLAVSYVPADGHCELATWDGMERRVLAPVEDCQPRLVGEVAGGLVFWGHGNGTMWTDGQEVRALGEHGDGTGSLLSGRLYWLGRADGDPALVATAGTAASTEVVHRFGATGTGSEPHQLVRHRDEVWLLAGRAPSPATSFFGPTVLWRTDGTPAGTHEVMEYRLGESSPDELVSGDRLFASTESGPLLAYDASGDGTVHGPEDCFDSVAATRGDIATSNGRAFFRCRAEGQSRQQLWTLGPGDTEAKLVVDANPDFSNDCGGPPGCDHDLEPPLDITPWPLGRDAGGVTFVAVDTERRPQLWLAAPDGSGARVLHTFDTGQPLVWHLHTPHDVTPLLADAAGAAVFAGYEAAGGWDLWRTDGTAAGTHSLGVFAGEGLVDLPFIVPYGGGAAFVARRADGLDELWTSDGTAAGTRRVDRLRLDGYGGEVESLAAAVDRLFLAVFHPTAGSELWISRGSGVEPLGLVAGPAGSRPHHLTAAGDVLLFAADDGVHGSELWASDGTVAGTRRVSDVAPGRASSDPDELVVLGERLVFVAGDPQRQRELWAIDDLGALLAASETCDGPVHCFQDERFRVAVTWDDDVTTGAAQPVPGASDDSGLFTFFSADNWEILVKVLDGCAIDGSYWVFAAAATHVGYTIEVTDRATGERRVYDKPFGPPAPALTATGAFACSP